MYFIYPVCFTRKSPLSPINNGSTLCHSRHMQAASKSWREKLKCYFLHSHSSWFRQTESARGRLIAVEIEAERLSFFLFFLKLSVLKVMCRYFHIWHTKGGTVTRLFFVGFFFSFLQVVLCLSSGNASSRTNFDACSVDRSNISSKVFFSPPKPVFPLLSFRLCFPPSSPWHLPQEVGEFCGRVQWTVWDVRICPGGIFNRSEANED